MEECDFYKQCIGRDGGQVTGEDGFVSVFALPRILYVSIGKQLSMKKQVAIASSDVVSAPVEWAVVLGF